MKKSPQSGNAVLLILIAVALFGALAYTFMRGSKSGQGNLTDNQARIAAQELVSFFSAVDKGVQKLRGRGCSENDISFANVQDAGTFITQNNPASAPVDKSCHIFDPNGAGLNISLNWKNYQISYDEIPVTHKPYHGQIRFRNGIYISGIGSTEYEIGFILDFVSPKICDFYNKVLNQTVDMTLYEESGGGVATAVGLINTALAGKNTACYSRALNQTKLYYIWLPR